MKRTILIPLLLVGIFSIVSIQSTAFAAEPITNAEENNEKLTNAIKLTEEALAHAKQGHQEQTVTALAEARNDIKSIHTGVTKKYRKKSQASFEIGDALKRAKKGKLEESIAFMEKGLPIMKSIEPFD